MTVQNLNTEISTRGKNFLRNFFGVNIFTEPNESWNYNGKFNGIRNEHYIFISNELKDKYFKKCKVLAFEGGGSNFLWDAIPYDDFIPYQIALTIERELLGNADMTVGQCIQKYEMTSTTSSFYINVGEYKIRIEFGVDKKEISLVLWTNLNKDELIQKAKEKYPNKIVEDPNNVPIIPKEQFLRNFFGVDILNAPDESWKYDGFKGEKNPFYFFYRNDIKDDFFNFCTVSVTENGERMFYWGPSNMAGLEDLKIATKIHRNLLGKNDFNITDAIKKYKDVVIYSQGTIVINHENLVIKIEHDSAKGTYSMILWTTMNEGEIIKRIASYQ